MRFIKLYIASLLVIFLLFIIWIEFYTSNCLVLIIPLIVLAVISSAYIELKLKERACFKACYINKDSIVAVLLSSRMLVILFYLVLSILMSISVLYLITAFQIEFWLYLVVHLLLIILLYKLFNRLFDNILNEDHKAIFSREWAYILSSLILIMVFVYFEMSNGYLPDYLQNSLDKTIKNASATYHSNCNGIDFILRLKVETDSVLWWAIEKNVDVVGSQVIRTGIWMAFLLVNSLALFGLNRFAMQIVYLLDKLFNLDVSR